MEKLLFAFLVFLLVVSAVQAYKLVELKNTIEEIKAVKPAYKPVSTGSSAAQQTGGLPQMVGGC